MIGTVIGNCQITEEIGRGGMGIVYKADQLSLGRAVAVKILPHHLTRDSSLVQRFLNEARAIAALNHPNIVQIYDVGEDQGTYFYTMELMEGASLDNILHQRGKFPLEQTIKIVAKVANALEYMHKSGIIHRDVKPSNIMIGRLGTVKLMDFGLALDERIERVTVEGGIVGTPEYMSPEQASGGNPTAPSDIYSLGVVFYELLTGRVPFEADTPLRVIKKIQTEEPVPPRAIASEIPIAAEKVILRMMAKDAEDRYQSCRSVLADLKRLQSGEWTSDLSPGFLSMRKLAVRAIPVILVLGLAGATSSYFWERMTSDPARQKSPLQEPQRDGELNPSVSAQRAAESGATPEQQEAAQRSEAGNGATRPETGVRASVEGLADGTPAWEVRPAIGQDPKEWQSSLAAMEKKLLLMEDASHPDTIVFSNENEVKCEIISETAESVRFRTENGTAQVPRFRVKQLTYATPEERESALRIRSEIDNIQRQQAELRAAVGLLADSGPPAKVKQDGTEVKSVTQIEVIDNRITVSKTSLNNEEQFHKADSSISDDFLRCVKENDLAAVVQYLQSGMKADVRDHNRHTPLMLAAIEGHNEMVTTLLEYRADLAARDVDGWTVLMYAVYKGNTTTARLLVERGADVNAKVKSGQTVLMIAAQAGHTDAGRLLIENGADIRKVDADGRSALAWARIERQSEFAEMLEEMGLR